MNGKAKDQKKVAQSLDGQINTISKKLSSVFGLPTEKELLFS